MITHDEERERAMELAIEHHDFDLVVKHLHEEGYGGLLSSDELEEILLEAKAAKEVMPSRPGRVLPRVVGVIALVLGVTSIILRHHWPTWTELAAVVLGVILIVKPSAAKEDV